MFVCGACGAVQPGSSEAQPAAGIEDAAAPVDAEPEAAAQAAAASTPAVLPDQCADDNAAGICGTPEAFARQICGGSPKPDVALRLYAKGSPWTRGYLRRNTEAWYTGRRSAKVSLKLQEEVVVLRHPGPKGGIVINGGDTPFDVMRLDGACATLGPDEVSLRRPDAPNHAPVPWRQLDPQVREALLADPSVAKASAIHDEACGEREGKACGWAKTRLTGAVLRFLARGGKVPMPVTWR
jgi:hypothetical protein